MLQALKQYLRSAASRYVTPTLFVGVALIFQFVFRALVGDRAFLFLYPSIFLGCLYGNKLGSIAATLIASVSGWYFFVPEIYSFSFADPTQPFALVIFLLSGLIASVLSEKLVKARETEFEKIRAQEMLQLRAEQELQRAQASLAELQDFFMQAPAPMVVLTGPKHFFVLANPPYERMVGRKVVGKAVLEAFTEAEVGDFIPLLDSVYKTGVPYVGNELPLNIANEKGEIENRFVSVTYHPFREIDGSIKGVFAVHLDVTAQVRARKLLERSKSIIENERDNFQNLFKQTPEMVCILKGPDHVFEFVNEAHIKALGFDATGMAVRVAQPESVEVHGILDNVYLTGQTAELHEIPVTVTGRLRYFNLTYAARRNIEGKIDGVMILGTEVTREVEARKELEQSAAELKSARDEAERANHLKSAFLANMSHEIRTPLGAMLGFANLLKEPTLSEAERLNYVEILTRNGEQLNRIIDDVLDLSKVEAGHLDLLFERTNVHALLEEVISLFSVRAREKNIVLRGYVDKSVPFDFITDSMRLRQVISNLIGNSIKFTHAGEVSVRAYCEEISKCRVLQIEVQDTGIGIEPESRDRLFKIFSQADVSLTRKFGGTGLGLALSRALAKQLGGDVFLKHSEINQGSTFQITIREHGIISQELPGAIKMNDTRNETPGEILKGISVLVVDDAPDNQLLIWRLLTKRGAVVELANNGLDAVERAHGGKYDLVLMDLQMPVMDGYTATRKLRASGYTKPIFALTAHAMSDVQRECFEAGCDGHLPKPVNVRELVQTILVWKDRTHGEQR